MSSDKDDMPGAAAPVLTAQLIQGLRELNEDYLELLSLIEPGGRLPDGLPERTRSDLRKSSTEARRLMATTAFSLYSLGFEDQQFWRSALRLESRSLCERYGAGSADARSAFIELALLHAWHVAVSQPIAARVVYGMSPPLMEIVGQAPLWQLRRIALAYPELLLPRWPLNPCFWPELVRYANASDLRRLHTVQQLGHQLIAIELQTSADDRSAARQRQQNLLRQRLRRST
jgi:hypothetical protein